MVIFCFLVLLCVFLLQLQLKAEECRQVAKVRTAKQCQDYQLQRQKQQQEHEWRLAKVILIFGRPFIKRFALCYRSVVCLPVCLSCLSVTLVHCGQTVGWIKTKLGTQIGLSTGQTVLDANPPTPHLKGHSPPIFGPYLLRPSGCMDQDATWY